MRGDWGGRIKKAPILSQLVTTQDTGRTYWVLFLIAERKQIPE